MSLVPFASAALYVAGQLILALTIATGHVPAGFGVVVCLAWLVCGLLLIAAQTIAPRPETVQSMKELSE